MDATNLDALRDLIKKTLDREPTLNGTSDIDDPDPTQRVIGVETENGDLYFLTIQPA